MNQMATPGSLMPEQPIMRKQSYASPFSFVGSTRREVSWARRHSTAWWKTMLATLALVVMLPVTWAWDALWFVVVVLLFGVFTFPYRLMRRSQRKQEAYQKQQLATMQAMLVNQQRTLNEVKPEDTESK